MRMKFLFEFPRYHTNNVGMVDALLEDGHHVVFSVTRQSIIENHVGITPVFQKQSLVSKFLSSCVRQNPAVLPFYFPGILSHFRFLRRIDFDVAVVRSPLRLIALMTLFYCFIFRRKVLFYSQSVVKKDQCLSKWVFRYSLAKIFRGNWICPLFFESTDFQKHVPFLVDFEAEDHNQKRLGKPDVLSLLVVAKSVPRKNIEFVILAVRALSDKGIDCSLTVVTEVSTQVHRQHVRTLKEVSKNLKVQEIVIFKENVKHAQMREIYCSHDVFILPSFNEPASVSVLEALASGCIVLTSNQNGTSTYFDHGVNGYIFDPNKVEDVLSILLRLHSDERVFNLIRYNGLLNAKGRTSKHVFLEKFHESIR